MKKNKLNVRSLIDQYQKNCDRISEIADVCEKEKRERNEAENAEFEAMTRDNQLLQMKMQAATAEHLRENPNAADDAITLYAGKLDVATLWEGWMMLKGASFLSYLIDIICENDVVWIAH